MYTTNTGYSRDLTAEKVAVNNFNACCEILKNGIDNGNLYWQRRLLAAYNELIRLDLVREMNSYQCMVSAEKDYAKNRSRINRAAVYHWWLRVRKEYSGKTPSIYHFD